MHSKVSLLILQQLEIASNRLFVIIAENVPLLWERWAGGRRTSAHGFQHTPNLSTDARV
jgi:hypothetical protein